jgi:very-short-patch-repair endonuclease
LDFYAHSIKLAIELDGSIHSLEEVKKNDGIRQEYLESLGIHFMRFDNKEIFANAKEVVDKIKMAVDRLTPPPLKGDWQHPDKL